MFGEWRDQFMSTHDFHLHLKARGGCRVCVQDDPGSLQDADAVGVSDTERSYASLIDSLPKNEFRNFLTVFTTYLTRTLLISDIDKMAFYSKDSHTARDALHMFIAAEDLNLLMFIYTMQYFMM